MLTALLFIPLCAGCIMLLWGRAVICRLGLPLTALAHTALAATIAVSVARHAGDAIGVNRGDLWPFSLRGY